MPARRRRYKTALAKFSALNFVFEAHIYRWDCGLFLRGFGDNTAYSFPPAAAKEKSQMPRAALAAAERPQEQEEQDGPLQDAAPVRAKDIFASAKRAAPRAQTKRDCMRSGHKSRYIVKR
jgi:hypothetical protein